MTDKSIIDDYLLEQHGNAFFQMIVKEIKRYRDHSLAIPLYNHKKDNTDEWMAASYERIGFDRACQFFNIIFKEVENGRGNDPTD